MSATTYIHLVNWLTRINQTDLPGKDIIAFNFGLFGNAKGCYTAYLIGSRTFDPTDDDWACSDDWAPAEKYLNLWEHHTETTDWQEVVLEMIDLLRQYTRSPECSRSFLANAIAITVGFDDGDLKRVK